MAVQSIIQGVADFFMKCPLLKDGAFHVNGLGHEAIAYSIDVDTADPIVKRYVNGDTLRQFPFTFSSREYYSIDRIQNIQNSAFYEMLSDWVEEKNMEEDFPELPDGCCPDSFSVLTPGYIFDEDMTSARYTIQFRLTYYKQYRKEE